tara:strand:+ start:630 stop:953 length:324 start_codon:yes stop_codon:yes gene_type:complete
MNKVYQKIFLYGLNASYVLYFLAVLGISSFAPKYLSYLRNFLKIYIGLLLVFLYNPITYKDKGFSEFDRKLVFSSGTFLLLSTTLISGIEEYIRQKSTNIINAYAFY